MYNCIRFGAANYICSYNLWMLYSMFWPNSCRKFRTCGAWLSLKQIHIQNLIDIYRKKYIIIHF